MAIPSGSGTEVLNMATTRALSNSWVTVLEGAANHIYTIISILATETGGNAETLSIGVADDASNTNFTYILNIVPIPVNGTFVFNDRFVFQGTKFLRMSLANAGDADIYVSYIDQDWT